MQMLGNASQENRFYLLIINLIYEIILIMTFQESIKHCLQNYANFNGRASKREFWWFFLFQFIVVLIAESISSSLGSLVSVLLIIPYLAVAVRRLHDVNKSGWWYLIAFTVVGVIVLIVWWCREPVKTGNKY